jgi:hypothetical protein
MTPMVVCIPFWEADKAQALDLVKILTGLQDHHVGSVVHLLLVARQDCKHDTEMIKLAMTKFSVFTFISPSPLRGWPNGPNAMFGRTISHIANNGKNKYEVIYWMEPDAIPLCPNWFMDLLSEWRKRHPKCLVIGSRGDCNGDGSGDHISGCALYHPNIAKLMPELTGCTGQAWDYKHRAKIVAVGQHTNMIENFYHARNAPENIADRSELGVRVIHGHKDRSVVISVAKKYGINIK